MKKPKVGILTSGGDAPGMNAAIRAATLVAIADGSEVIGVERGYSGLIEGAFRSLSTRDVDHIIHHGGTILGTARSKAFMTREGRDKARKALREAHIEKMVIIGGNGSLAGARALADPEEQDGCPVHVIGLPASIDNDIGYTRLSIGVDTAMNTIVEACDRISDTAEAHDRVFIIEVMGRDCGYLAMATSVAAAADVVLFRESGKSNDEIVNDVTQAIIDIHGRRPYRRIIIIKSEGVALPTTKLKERVDNNLAAAGIEMDTRITILGHIVRGGCPSALDRMMASRLAHVGVRALLAGHTGKMVAWSPSIELPASAHRSPHDPRCALIEFDDVMDETQRLLSNESPITQWRIKVFDEMGHVLRL